jgi:hypothetical protein
MRETEKKREREREREIKNRLKFTRKNENGVNN